MADQSSRFVAFDGKMYQFPADATDAEVSAALGGVPAANARMAPKARTWSDWLPAIGGALGTLAGGAVGQPAAGAALGGAAGEGYKQLVQNAGELVPAMRDVASNLRSGAAGATVKGGYEGEGAGLGRAALTAGEQGGAVLLGQAVAPYVKAALPAVGKGLSAVGDLTQRAAQSRGMEIAQGSGVLGELMGGDLKKALIAAVAPALLKGGGKALSTAGSALARVGAPAAESAVSDLADDVSLLRASIAKGMRTDTAVRIVSGGDPAYGQQLTKALVDSVKTQGMPIPVKSTPAQLAALQQLMKAGSMSQLPTDANVASSVAARNAGGAWVK